MHVGSRRESSRARIALALAWLGVGASVSLPPEARAENSHQPVNFSFFYPHLSTNRHPDVSTNFRVGILYGRVASVRGVDLTAIVARTDEDFQGLQLVGVHAWTGGTFRGISLTGVVNVVGGAGRGIQLTGAANFDRDRFTGGQFAGVLNYAGGDFKGLQLTSVLNLCDAGARGLQLATIANTAAGPMVGLQLAGFNLAMESVHGIQAGYCNFSPEVRGAQVGLVNLADTVHGSQIGIWNQCRRLDGVPVGAVNLVTENGLKDWVAYATSYAAVNFGLRTGANGWYSVLALGVSDLDEKRSNTVFLSCHYGHLFDLHAPWRIGTDVGFLHVIPQPADDPGLNDRLHFAAQARVLAERPMAENIRFFFGGGVNVIWSEYSSNAVSETKPLVVAGVAFE